MKAKKKAKAKIKTVKKSVAKRYTPQQIDFAIRYYLPSSPTFGNALQSALKAGYSQEYAESITARNLDWIEKILSEIVGNPTDKSAMVEKAKKVLDKALDSSDAKLAQDTAKFIAKTTPEFSEKQDITSGGEKIEMPPLALVEFVNGTGDSKA